MNASRISPFTHQQRFIPKVFWELANISLQKQRWEGKSVEQCPEKRPLNRTLCLLFFFLFPSLLYFKSPRSLPHSFCPLCLTYLLMPITPKSLARLKPMISELWKAPKFACHEHSDRTKHNHMPSNTPPSSDTNTRNSWVPVTTGWLQPPKQSLAQWTMQNNDWVLFWSPNISSQAHFLHFLSNVIFPKTPNCLLLKCSFSVAPYGAPSRESQDILFLID